MPRPKGAQNDEASKHVAVAVQADAAEFTERIRNQDDAFCMLDAL
ncbi:hypothetical protein RISK_001259 [Rhodopirellula islandica]|uniref:Uncharacterized protein n=1 Tax=Rhodopirellula islandica TaxID=595434 RepID=A0A0J1BJG0_RHOIS|nr:hypothetical protein [Rhodopirellula islandica]KLU06695.1 hypothetical protein RISK_001259 [Rhodopirellula islandica]